MVSLTRSLANGFQRGCEGRGIPLNSRSKPNLPRLPEGTTVHGLILRIKDTGKKIREKYTTTKTTALLLQGKSERRGARPVSVALCCLIVACVRTDAISIDSRAEVLPATLAPELSSQCLDGMTPERKCNIMPVWQKVYTVFRKEACKVSNAESFARSKYRYNNKFVFDGLCDTSSYKYGFPWGLLHRRRRR